MTSIDGKLPLVTDKERRLTTPLNMLMTERLTVDDRGCRKMTKK